MKRLDSGFSKLSDWVSGISVGIQTSANDIYHMIEIAKNRFRPIGFEGDNFELEPDLLHPLIKGPDVKRYITPKSSLSILVPYSISERGATLISSAEMEKRFPKTWRFLQAHETFLRERERGKMDRDDCWWGYNYPKNIDKQQLPRLMIAGTATGIRIACDASGEFTQDDRRVFAIIPEYPDSLFYLLGILNSPVPEFVFRRIARPKANGYYDIEQQFLAPLPVPKATSAERTEVGSRARHLQELHTARHDKIILLQRRLNADQCTDSTLSEDWLWADVKTVSAWKCDAPVALSAREKTTWAKERRATYLSMKLEKIEAVLNPGTALTVEEHAGEVRLLAAGVALASVVADQAEAPFIAAQWRQIARTTNITDKFKAKTLVKALLSLRQTANPALRNQATQFDKEIQDLDSRIAEAEAEMNKLVFKLYKLTDDEIRLVEEG